MMSTNQDVHAGTNGMVSDSALVDNYDMAQQEYSEDGVIANTSLELLEQHQAKEQARLLHRFRELRQWQQQQQQQLMLQQQQQLKAWQDEQSKVQSLIAIQRGSQWKQSKVVKPNLGGSGSPIMTPPTKPHSSSGNFPHKDTGTVNQSQGAGISLDSGLVSMQDTLKSQNSLPKPVMYIDPSKSLNANDEDKYTNSELFSNPPVHDDQLDILKEDDHRPAPDWMSDTSENFICSKLPPPRPGRNGTNDQLAGLEQLLHTAPAGLLQQVLNLLPANVGNRTQPNHNTDAVERSASPSLPGPGRQPRARKLQFQQPSSTLPLPPTTSDFFTAAPAQSQQYSSQQVRQHQQHPQQFTPRNLMNGHQNMKLGPAFIEPEEDSQFIPRAVMLNDDGMSEYSGGKHNDNQEAESEEEWEDEDDEGGGSDDVEEDDNDDDDDQNVTVKKVNDSKPDDRPIQGTGGTKTFEQLLEEQLKEEKDKLARESEESSGKPRKKTFLRKGEGIARFSSAPKKPVKRPPSKSNRRAHPTQQEQALPSKDAAKSKRESGEGSSKTAESGDGNKKSSVGSRLKDMSKLVSSKPAEKKVKSNLKGNTVTQDAPSQGKPVAKLTLIHNVASKKLEEQRSRQKEVGSARFQRAEMDHIDLFRNGRAGGIVEKSPSLDSRSTRSDDHDSTELDSLAEFELLEDAVDNMSFCSNSSLVKKLVTSDKADQKEAIHRLKTINETKKTVDENTNKRIFPDTSDTPREDDKETTLTSGQKVSGEPDKSEGETIANINYNSNNNNNNNNNKESIHLVEPKSDSSDVTLSDTSDEENENRDPWRAQNGITSSPPRVHQAGVTSDPPQSPSKVMTRKVAPLASKFATANDTLSMLKTLSLQAGLLTSGGAAESNKVGNAGPFIPLVTSSSSTMSVPSTTSNSLISNFPAPSASTSNSLISNFPAPFASTASSSHHSIQPSASFFHSPQFPGLSTVPSDFKFGTFPSVQDGAISQSSTAVTQNTWSEAKPVVSDLPTMQLARDPTKLFGSQLGVGSDDPMKTQPQGKMYNSNLYGSQFEKESDDDSEDDDEDNSEDADSPDENDPFPGREENKMRDKEDDRPLGEGTKNKGKTEEGELKTTKASLPPQVAFDDEMAWIDDDGDDDDETCLKVPASTATTTATANSTPPTSKLVSRLFPKLKPKPSVEAEKATQALHQATAQPIQASDGVQSRILRDKLMELDTEIERFRSENANLEKLRREREEGLAKLKQEIENFQQEKEKELKRLEEFKTEEMKKLKRERKLFDNYQKKIRSMPDKKEREEIDALKNQLQELQDELKRKESRWNASTARLKNRVAEVELENGELKEEVRILEKKRLEWMAAQASAKSAVTSNGKVGQSENRGGKSELTVRQPATSQPRSSTPTKEVDPGKTLALAVQRENFPQAISSAAPLRSAIPTMTSATAGAGKGGKNHPKSSIGNAVSGYGTNSNAGSTAMQNGTVLAPSKTSGTPVASANSVNLSGEGLQAQNVAIPVMMENTLPVGTQASSMPGSLASSVSPCDKSAALMALERAVVDKGDASAFVETKHLDGKIEKTFKTGAKEIHFPNGTVKEISADGQTIVCRLANGDIRQIFPDHRVIYIFAEAQIMQTTFPDGLETFQFKNGQIERRYPDGTVEITFPSKDVKYLFPDGGQEVILTDGTVMQYNSKGERTIEYPTGDREVHTAEYQRREFPDGIIKTVYADGRHETRFPNGRVRMRDKAGNVIMDQIVYR